MNKLQNSENSILADWLKIKEKEIISKFEKEALTTEDMIILALKANFDQLNQLVKEIHPTTPQKV